MGADDERTRTLVRASADITLRLMPELSKEVRHLGRTWRDQEVLNPPEAERTAELIQARLAALTPQLTELRQRQDEIARELRDLIIRERDG